MIKISETNQVKWMKAIAIISIILLFVLIIGYGIDQVQWSQFKHQFAMNGYAVRIKDKFAIGIDKIIRGDEANQYLKANNEFVPKVQDGYEILVLKLKIKNLSKNNIEPWKINLLLSAKGERRYGDTLYNPDNLVRNDFTNPKMFKTFNPGEVREGIQVYEIGKGKPLFDLDIICQKKLQYAYEKILFSPSIWNNVVFKVMRILFLYILFLLMLYNLFQQRKKKTDGKVWSSILVFILPFLVTFDEIFVSSLSDKIFLASYLGGLLFLVGFTFLISRRVLMDFFCLAYKDKLLLIEEFVKQMQWDNPKITNAHGNTTITDPNSKTSYIFRLSNIWVKNPTKDTPRVKKVLLDLYSKSRFDFKSFYLMIALIHFVMIFYFYGFVILFK